MHVLRRSSSSYRLAMRLSSPCSSTGFSRDFVRCRETTGSPSNIPSYNRESRHLASILLLQLKEERRLITNQPDSARFSQISRIPPNQQDSPEPARFSRIGQTLISRIPASESSGHSATASIHRAISLHSFPQLRDSVVSPHPPSRDSSGSFGFVGIDRVGPGPCLLIVV